MSGKPAAVRPTADAALDAASTVLTMLRRIVTSARAVTQADAAALLLYDAEADRFVPVVPSVAVGLDERWLQRQGLAALQTLAQQAVAAREVVAAPDTAGTPALDLPLLAGGRRPGAVAVAPLTSDGTVVGTLNVLFAAPFAAGEDRERAALGADRAVTRQRHQAWSGWVCRT